MKLAQIAAKTATTGEFYGILPGQFAVKSDKQDVRGCLVFVGIRPELGESKRVKIKNRNLRQVSFFQMAMTCGASTGK